MEKTDRIEFEDFLKVDIRVGTIIRAEPFPEARKAAYKLDIDFGSFGTKRSSAQITNHYTIDQLIKKQVLAVVNFNPKQIGKFISEVLVLGLSDESGKIVLLEPNISVPNGRKVH